VLVPLLLVTGSRAGLILGLIGTLLAFLLFRKPASLNAKKRKVQKFDPRYLLIAFIILCLGALTLIMSRAEAFQRLFAAGPGEEDRFKVWVPMAEMAWKYFPFGSGIGSFVEVYQIDEPYALLSAEYYNHAHNDWLEVFFTAGLPGLLLLGSALLFFFRRSRLALFAAPGRSVTYAKLGSAIILILAIGSIGDYPLRVPSIACLFVVAALWLAGDKSPITKRRGTIGELGLDASRPGRG
jgi:O-antigen ligase